MLVAATACSDPSTVRPSDGGDGHGLCGTGAQHATACLPVLESCGDREVPVPGGGCTQVGVPSSCPTGWSWSQEGWCTPILPATGCPTGTTEVIGKSTCQPLGDCGNGPWGGIVTKTDTIFVDQAYRGSDADGSRTRPYQTVGAALAAVSPGGHLAVAAGVYAEDLVIGQAVTIEGRCAQQVTVQGVSTASLAATVTASADGLTLRGLTITGPGTGVLVNGGRLALERVAIESCGSTGIAMRHRASVELRGSRLAQNGGMGIMNIGSHLSLAGSVVKDTRPWVDQTFGTGIWAGASKHRTDVRPVLELSDSVIAGNRGVGLAVEDSDVTVRRTVIKDTREEEADRGFGYGIQATYQYSASKLAVSDSLVHNNRGYGVRVNGSDATIERTAIAGTRPLASDKKGGVGIEAKFKHRAPKLVLRDSVVADSRVYGVSLRGATATLERVVIRSTGPQLLDKMGGIGVAASPREESTPVLSICDTLLLDNLDVGVLLLESRATLRRLRVKNTAPNASRGAGGIGIYLEHSGDARALELEDSLLEHNRSVGLALRGAASVKRSVVRNTRKDRHGRLGDGIEVIADVDRKASVELEDSLIEGNARAGAAFFGGAGVVRRSVIRSNVLAINLADGANPSVETDNVYEGNVENGIAYDASVTSAPAPLVPDI